MKQDLTNKELVAMQMAMETSFFPGQDLGLKVPGAEEDLAKGNAWLKENDRATN